MNLKKIIREEVNNEFQWVKDIKSNKDIAEELFNQTVITKDKVKFPFMTSNIHSKKYYFDPSIKKKYGKDVDSDDIWERYKVLVNNRLKEITGKDIKESNDLDWIKDIKPSLNDAFEKATLKLGDVLTLSGKLADCDARKTIEVNDFKIKITRLRKKINNSHFIPLQKKYWEHLEYDGEGDTRFYTSDGKMQIEDHHNELMESNELQWIKDINPIPEIKIGTCFVDEMSGGIGGEKWIIKSIREKPSMTIIEVVNSKGKSVTLNKKYFEEDLLYGRYKGCIKSIKESDDLQWIRDINPKVDEETIDILYNKPFYWYSPLEKSKWVTFQGMPKIYWLEDGIDSAEVKVCTHRHNKEGFYVKDCEIEFSSKVAGKFNRGVYVLQPKLTNINESKNDFDDFSWVNEIPQYNFYNGEYYIDISGLDDDEACEVQQAIINMGIDWEKGDGEVDKDHCDTFFNKGYIIRRAVLYRTTILYDEYIDTFGGGNKEFITYINGRTDLLG